MVRGKTEGRGGGRGAGWRINGQKVWTSSAHVADFGLATVRTNPDAPKHEGITMMVIDMHAPGVTVRPLRMPSGDSDFNEVFFDDVFVPDSDVVGPVDGGWTVARATLGKAERQHRRRRRWHDHAGRRVHRPIGRTPRAAPQAGLAGSGGRSTARTRWAC